jgi:hypothetical protein
VRGTLAPSISTKKTEIADWQVTKAVLKDAGLSESLAAHPIIEEKPHAVMCQGTVKVFDQLGMSWSTTSLLPTHRHERALGHRERAAFVGF